MILGHLALKIYQFNEEDLLFLLMQPARSLLPTGRKRVKLTSRGEPLIPGFAVGNELDHKNRNRAK
jgi:hypothetical protein